MKFNLMEVRGLATACLSLKMSKRSYTEEYEDKLREAIAICTMSRNGFILPRIDENAAYHDFLIGELDKVAKWGAGFGVDGSLQAGHDTLLRFIDLHIHVEGLHYAGIADLDSHAMRMGNRIVRSSSRLTTKGSTELSDWYKNKVIPLWDVDKNIPQHIKRDGHTFVYNGFGYIREDLIEDKDVLRGLYPLGMASDCIFVVDLFDMRHIYKRRNEFTHAAPELREGIEDLAYQIEAALPCMLGKSVRYDYCADGKLHHVMDIDKTARSKEND